MSEQVNEAEVRTDVVADAPRLEHQLAGTDNGYRIDKQLQAIAAGVARLERKLDRILALSVESRRNR